MTVGDKATSVKGIFQQQAKTVANLCAAARPDLTVRRKRRSTRSFHSFTLSFAPRARARVVFLLKPVAPERANSDLGVPYPPCRPAG
jgi:hypothetical protein